MSEMHISEELWMRFLDGNVSEEENERLMRLLAEDDELLAEYLTVSESLKRVDSKPLASPDLELAQKRISEVENAGGTENEHEVILPRRSNFRKYSAMAAAAAFVIGVALFFLFRPDSNDNNLAQQEKKRVEMEKKTQGQNQETTVKTEQTDKTRQNDMPSKNDAEGVQPEPTNAQPEECTTQMMEKQYAQKAQANSLTVTKPNKNDYRVLCKNLEKTLDFEWSAMNVQTLHFEVKDPKGKTVAETRDVSTRHYELKYQDIQPEKKLTWALEVVFKDGAQEKRTGQVQIDYNY